MNSDEDQDVAAGAGSGNTNKKVLLKFQNFIQWRSHVCNKFKELRCPELEYYIMTGNDPKFILPTMDTKVALDPSRPNDLSKRFADDEFGKEECKFHRTMVMKREARFKDLLPQAMAIMYDHIGEQVLKKMKLDPTFEPLYRNNNVIEILRMAEFTSMGEGSSTVYKSIAQLVSNKVAGNDITSYITRYQNLRRTVTEGKDPKTLLEMFCDTVFIMGLKDFAPLAKQIDEVMGKKIWPPAEDLIVEWMTMLTVKGDLGKEAERKSGMIDANLANSGKNGGRGLSANAAKFTRSGNDKKKKKQKKKKCFRCGEEAEHNAMECPMMTKYGPAVCKICRGDHCSKVHNEYFSHVKAKADVEDDGDGAVLGDYREFKQTWNKKMAAAARHAGDKSGNSRPDRSGKLKTASRAEASRNDSSSEDEFFTVDSDDADTDDVDINDVTSIAWSRSAVLSNNGDFYCGVGRHRMSSNVDTSGGTRRAALGGEFGPAARRLHEWIYKRISTPDPNPHTPADKRVHATGVRFEPKRKVWFETDPREDKVEVILDTGSDGHIVPVSVMTKVRPAPKGSYVKGMGGGAEPLTHEG